MAKVAAFLSLGLAFVVGTLCLSSAASARQAGYHLIVEDGIDAITVREIVAERLGAPVKIDYVKKSQKTDPSAIAAVVERAGHGRMLVVGCPGFVAAVEDAAHRRPARDRALRAEVGRAIAEDKVELALFI